MDVRKHSGVRRWRHVSSNMEWQIYRLPTTPDQSQHKLVGRRRLSASQWTLRRFAAVVATAQIEFGRNRRSGPGK